MLVANAWHARSDAASSLVVAVGIGGSLLGYRFLDPVAAVIVGFMIAHMGVKFTYEAMQELIDTGIPHDELDRIRETLRQTPGVIDLHDLRTRRMAHKILVDAHIQVDGRISVSEGHRIAEHSRARTLRENPEVLDVLVHVDPEDDLEPGLRGAHLPDRDALSVHLREVLGDDAPPFERVVLHYLGNRVEAEIFLPTGAGTDKIHLAAIRQRLADRLPADPYFDQISVHYKIAPQ
jgi:hypothetical protein